MGVRIFFPRSTETRNMLTLNLTSTQPQDMYTGLEQYSLLIELYVHYACLIFSMQVPASLHARPILVQLDLFPVRSKKYLSARSHELLLEIGLPRLRMSRSFLQDLSRAVSRFSRGQLQEVTVSTFLIQLGQMWEGPPVRLDIYSISLFLEGSVEDTPGFSTGSVRTIPRERPSTMMERRACVCEARASHSFRK